MCLYLPSILSLPPLQVITEHQAQLPVLCSNFPLASSLTHNSIYMSTLLSQFIPPSPCLTVSMSLFSISASPSFPCKQVHQYHFSRFHIYALICDIFFSYSDSKSLSLIHSIVVTFFFLFVSSSQSQSFCLFQTLIFSSGLPEKVSCFWSWLF